MCCDCKAAYSPSALVFLICSDKFPGINLKRLLLSGKPYIIKPHRLACYITLRIVNT